MIAKNQMTGAKVYSEVHVCCAKVYLGAAVQQRRCTRQGATTPVYTWCHVQLLRSPKLSVELV